MLFDGKHRCWVQVGECVEIERLDAGAVPNGCLDIFFCEQVGSGKSLSENRSTGEQRGVRTCAKALPAASRKSGIFGEHGLAFFANAQVGGLLLSECPAHSGAQLGGVGRSQNIHFRQAAHDGQVFE